MAMVDIYGLRDPRTQEIHYVGKANDAKVRYLQHLSRKDITNRYKWKWISKLASLGMKPQLVILEVTDDEHWEERERYWIKYGRDNGWPLTNIASGGAYAPQPANKRYDWASLMRMYMPAEEADRFETLPEEKQKEICQQTALRMMEFSWLAIRERGGDPALEYNKDRQYWAGSDMARSLLAATC